ncbi:MAG: hypothetical protein ACOYOP_00520 [Microthrixaceae bacterium]
MQGVIKSYDPATKDGIVLCDVDLAEYDLAPDALDGSVFRMLRQGQRVRFHLDAEGRAAGLNLGSERDMGTPDFSGHAEPAPDGA